MCCVLTMADLSSSFASATKAILAERPKKRHTKFIEEFCASPDVVTAEDVNQILAKMEQDSSQKGVKKILRPVFEAVCDYDAIISTMVSANPMPSALIWGGLKAVVECFKRYAAVFEKIETQLIKLTQELKFLKRYEELFKQYTAMEQLLTQSYINIIRFWIKVEELCSEPVLKSFAKSITSARTKKLGDVLDAITDGSNNIVKMVPIIQEQIRRSEQGNAIDERRRMEAALGEMLKLQQDTYNAINEPRMKQRKAKIYTWLRGRENLNEDNYRHQRNGKETLFSVPGAGDWIVEDPQFQVWLDGKSAQNSLWLRGDPGSGKSVICSRAVMEAEKKSKENLASFAFQYFSFDNDNMRPMMAYQNIAFQLFYEFDGYDDISEILVDLTELPDKEVALQKFIETMIMESKSTYIFLDGIDEELQFDKTWERRGENKRWKNARSFLRFFVNLAQHAHARLKLWCSSQDHPEIRQELSAAQELLINELTNSRDIELFFQHILHTKLNKRFHGFDADVAASVLKLKTLVHGNFLWATMMVGRIDDAGSIAELIRKLDEHLPPTFEGYLTRQVRNLKPSPYVVKILSVLAYAKRPLSLEELCEAIEILNVMPGQNIGGKERIFEDTVNFCIPLIRVDQTTNNGAKICTLCHGSVKEFLELNPRILKETGVAHPSESDISPGLLAELCLKYLQQPRYSNILTKAEDDTFETSCGQNVLDHHLLVYCAKYWALHMESLRSSPELRIQVEQFVKSQHFMTCIQVQSLFVGENFRLHVSHPEHIRLLMGGPPFPAWLGSPVESQLNTQYHLAVEEWSYFLDDCATINGNFPGQLNLCAWGTLGKSNFLHKMPSKIRSYALENDNERNDEPGEVIYDKVLPLTAEIFVFRLNKRQLNDEEVDIVCELWDLRSSHSPKLRDTQHLIVPFCQVDQFHWRDAKMLSFDFALMSLADNGDILRIGTQLYRRKGHCVFEPLGEPDVANTIYSGEATAPRDTFDTIVALASRRIASSSIRETKPHENISPHVFAKDKQTQPSDALEEGISSSLDTSDDSGSENDETEDDTRNLPGHTSDLTKDPKTDEPNSIFSVNNSSVNSGLSETDDIRSAIRCDSLSELDSSESCSVKEYLDDGLSDPLSYELDAQFPWNTEESSDIDVSSFGTNKSKNTHTEDDLETEPPNNSDSGSIKSYSPSDYVTFGVMSEHDTLNILSRRRKYLTRFLELEESANPNERTSNIRILRINRESGDRYEIFKRELRVGGSLLYSPPALHPSMNLALWPNGKGEGIFGDYEKKTCFQWKLVSSLADHRLVSMKARFSLCGSYLHIASLYAFECLHSDCVLGTNRVHYNLLITTHRLSKCNPTISPPRLVYRNVFELLSRIFAPYGLCTQQSLGFTLTWTKEYLFVAISGTLLRVIRIPLFQAMQKGDLEWEASNGICENDGTVFLPESSHYRDIYYLPISSIEFPKSPKKKDKQKHNEEDIVAVVFLSSGNKYSSLMPPIDSSCLPPKGSPQIVYLTASQLGNWTALSSLQMSNAGHRHLTAESKPIENRQVLEKFEKRERCALCRPIFDEYLKNTHELPRRAY
ncbi:hypothetical protein F5B20DRAFT_590137 [Whalleya microplaca]|nr:hypothetical protein F5B20DRAFT_590137 [Whalleya microplaca]